MNAKNINEKQFQEMMASGETVLVDFWAPWCTYCRRISAAYDKVAQQNEGKLQVVKVNIDEEPNLAQGEGIEVIPTLVLYRGGQPIGSVVAPESKAAIDSFLQDALTIQ